MTVTVYPDAVGPAAEPQVGRSALIGAAIGFLVALVALTAGGTALGVDLAGSLAFGAFVGSWGGAGFGFMVGATLPLARHADREEAAKRAARGA